MRLRQRLEEAVHERQELVGELKAGRPDVLVDDEEAVRGQRVAHLVEQVLESLDVMQGLGSEDGAVPSRLELDRVQVGGRVRDAVGDAGLLGLLLGDRDCFRRDVVGLEAAGDVQLEADPLDDAVAAAEAEREVGGTAEEAVLGEREPADVRVSRDRPVDVARREHMRLPVEASPLVALGLLASLLAPVLRGHAPGPPAALPERGRPAAWPGRSAGAPRSSSGARAVRSGR